MKNSVRALRTARGWTQADLAAQLSVSRNSVNAIETGRYEPSLTLALRIAKLFGERVEDIFVLDGDTPPAPGSAPRS
jgi:putative transcriptional regulator